VGGGEKFVHRTRLIDRQELKVSSSVSENYVSISNLPKMADLKLTPEIISVGHFLEDLYFESEDEDIVECDVDFCDDDVDDDPEVTVDEI